jgi:hypothetical protein
LADVDDGSWGLEESSHLQSLQTLLHSIVKKLIQISMSLIAFVPFRMRSQSVRDRLGSFSLPQTQAFLSWRAPCLLSSNMKPRKLAKWEVREGKERGNSAKLTSDDVGELEFR